MGLVDVVKMSEAMLKLATDKELRREKGKAARKFAEQNFDWNEITTQHCQLIECAQQPWTVIALHTHSFPPWIGDPFRISL